MTQQATLSPMMQQWHDLKEKQKEALLLFRLGDFYEAFYEDAKILSDVLDITLTKRQDIPMSGIPYHSCSNYLDELLRRGYKIAIAEQIENPKEVKGLVKRDIVKILSPGASVDTANIDDKRHHFIAHILYKKGSFCISWLDISLNDAYYHVMENISDVLNLLSLIGPKELLIDKSFEVFFNTYKNQLPHSILYHEIYEMKSHEIPFLENLTKEHFGVFSLNSLGLTSEIAQASVGKLLHILKKDRLYDLKNIKSISSSDKGGYLIIDKATQSHLELFEKKEGKYQNLTLFNHLNHTLTAPGSRLFESWLKFPLLNKDLIKQRQEGVKFLHLWEKKSYLVEILRKVKDITKILTKINLNAVNPPDLKHLQHSLEAILDLKGLYEDSFSEILKQAFYQLDGHEELITLLEKAIIDVPATRLSEAPTFKKGYHQELDELILLTESQEEFLKDYEASLREETGIKTLKVGSSKNFGFYIEISKGQAQNAPSHFVRRQTLTNQERFITEKLHQFEKKAQDAKQHLARLEHMLFTELTAKISQFADSLTKTAHAASIIDVLQSLAKTAAKSGYSLPELSDDNVLVMTQARHPIIEELLEDQQFIPNDLCLNNAPESFMLITGPNMGGKSTYMRQAALCVIMAQIGSYVPASYMKLSPIDRLFTRIGASDDLTSGQSTFMVEMAETSYILKNATKQSLVILDEIGRGTSTYDGIAIAYAISKYLLNHPAGLPKTLFATHYFELTELAAEDERVANCHAGAKDEGGKLLFLHKIEKGPADKSYGIQVAKLAGLPEEVIELANYKLRCLLDPDFKKALPQASWQQPAPVKHRLVQELEQLHVDNLTPLDALNLLNLWKKQFST